MLLPFEIIIFLHHVVNVYLLKMFCATAATTLQRKENYSTDCVSVKKLYLFLDQFGFTLKERCACVYNITRAKMKHILHYASLDSPTRISGNCVFSLTHGI